MLTEETVESPRAIARRATPRSHTRVAGRPRSQGKARFFIAGLIIVAAIGYMIYSAMQSGSEYFVTTSELKTMGEKAIGQPLKIGGQVVEGSVQRTPGGSTMAFSITDGAEIVPVSYTGIVPDAFQEGAGVILEGKAGADGTFQASTLLAKCASKYEPK